MRIFVLDVIGRDSQAGRIMQLKLYSDVNQYVVTWTMKAFTIALVFILDVYMIFMVLLYAAAKSQEWQSAWVFTAALQLCLDVFFNAFLEAIVIFYWIPSLVTDKVQEMRVTLNHVVEKLFTAEIEIKQHKKRSNFSSSEYFHISAAIAKTLPELNESALILSFRNALPGTLKDKWETEEDVGKLQEKAEIASYVDKFPESDPRSTSAQSYMKRQKIYSSIWRGLLRVKLVFISGLVAAGTLPLFFQRLIIQIIQPLLIACIGYLAIVIVKDPGLFYSCSVLFGLLVFGGIIRFAISSWREQKRKMENIGIDPTSTSDKDSKNRTDKARADKKRHAFAIKTKSSNSSPKSPRSSDANAKRTSSVLDLGRKSTNSSNNGHNDIELSDIGSAAGDSENDSIEFSSSSSSDTNTDTDTDTDSLDIESLSTDSSSESESNFTNTQADKQSQASAAASSVESSIISEMSDNSGNNALATIIDQARSNQILRRRRSRSRNKSPRSETSVRHNEYDSSSGSEASLRLRLQDDTHLEDLIKRVKEADRAVEAHTKSDLLEQQQQQTKTQNIVQSGVRVGESEYLRVDTGTGTGTGTFGAPKSYIATATAKVASPRSESSYHSHHSAISSSNDDLSDDLLSNDIHGIASLEAQIAALSGTTENYNSNNNDNNNNNDNENTRGAESTSRGREHDDLMKRLADVLDDDF